MIMKIVTEMLHRK